MRRLALLLTLAITPALAPAAASAGPPPMDPRRMSGIPRPDPQVPAGTVTVRCLLGSFSEPAVDLEVTLEVKGTDGKSETRTARTQEQGRATFEGLEGFAGGTAVATTTFDGETVSSAPIALQPNMGSRVLLVKGASAPPAGQPPGAGASPHGGAGDIPPPGKAFEIDGHPAGTLIVGTLDLENKGRVEGIEVTLTITPPEGEPSQRTGSSDASGRVVFRDLLPPEVPEGSKLVVEAGIRPDSDPQRSEPFSMGERPVAIYLAEGLDKLPQRQAPPPPPQGRPQLPGPRVMPDLAAGTVRVRLVDGQDRPVPDQPLEIWKKDVTGNDVKFTGTTGADGIALVEGVTVQSDAFYFVGVPHDGAPYQSGFFEMTPRAGVAVDLRVFPTTDDRSRVRSAVQIEVRPRENDMAQVTQVYQVFVEGEEAFWPGKGGLKIGGPEGTKSLVVLRQAQAWLAEKEGAPFATLDGPIPPGQVANLSVAYLVPHDGELEVTWQAPFPLVESSVILGPDLELVSPSVEPTRPQHETAEDIRFFPLGDRPLGASITFVVGSLPVRPAVFRWIALGLGLVVTLGLGVAMWRRPSRSERERLEARRQELEVLLPSVSGPERDQLIAALDDVYRRLDALAEQGDVAPAAAD